ncbi:unnamed protein product [Lepidochelys kempii]
MHGVLGNSLPGDQPAPWTGACVGVSDQTLQLWPEVGFTLSLGHPECPPAARLDARRLLGWMPAGCRVGGRHQTRHPLASGEGEGAGPTEGKGARPDTRWLAVGGTCQAGHPLAGSGGKSLGRTPAGWQWGKVHVVKFHETVKPAGLK